jgi:CheY-like chemotaxis protein
MQTLGTVLVVEPNKHAQREIRKALPEINAVFVADGKAFVAEAKLHQPAAIVMNEGLPSSDGFEILKAARANGDVPVLLLTSRHALEESGHEHGTALVLGMGDLSLLQGRLSRLIAERTVLKSFRDTYLKVMDAQSAGAESEFTKDETEVLRSVGFRTTPKLNPAPLAARAAHFQTLLSSSLTTERAAKRLRVNASRIRQRLTTKPPQLYGIRHNGEWRLPAFQFGTRGLIPNVDRAISRLPSGIDPVAVDRWFRQPNADLQREGQPTSPLDWLAQGLPAGPVAELAADL